MRSRKHSFLALPVIRLIKREEELVTIRIGDPDHVVTPPRFLSRHRTLQDLAPKLIDSIPVEFHEQPAFVPASRIFTQDDFALPTIDLADCPRAVAGMLFLLETQLLDVRSEGGR